jgi:hypothetical protein
VLELVLKVTIRAQVSHSASSEDAVDPSEARHDRRTLSSRAHIWSQPWSISPMSRPIKKNGKCRVRSFLSSSLRV